MEKKALPVQTKHDIFNVLAQDKTLLAPYKVKKLGLFGSFARGEQTNTSDIDFLVEFEPGQKTFDNFIQLSFCLEDILEREVELVTPESLSQTLQNKILSEIEYVAFNA